NKTNLEIVDTSFAKVFEEYNPSSYILQAANTDRYILTEGEGRRIDQLRPYIQVLPETLKEIEDEYGTLDAINLVGLHVIFGNKLEVSDHRIMTETIDKLRNRHDSIFFTDAGGITGMEEEERKRLWEIYSQFDAISLNRDEILQIAGDISDEDLDEIEAMNEILNKSENISTVWLHTSHYQISLTSEFEKVVLKAAQDNSALAGLYRVEEAGYPTIDELVERKEKRKNSEEGKRVISKYRDKHGDVIDDRELIYTPCYEAEKFETTVGAGDVSAAAFLSTITDEVRS
ncbi:MAG: ADP-dependent glucokinase/phosphofructokinase, partial [Candidatus Aenigmatarchaeota archaeon]